MDPQVAEVQEEGCAALQNLTLSMYRPINMSHGQQSAAEAGAVEAVLDAMQAHMQLAQVQLLGLNALRCVTLHLVRFGETATEAAVLKAAVVGAPQVVVEAMRAHPQVAAVQEAGGMSDAAPLVLWHGRRRRKAPSHGSGGGELSSSPPCRHSRISLYLFLPIIYLPHSRAAPLYLRCNPPAGSC